MPVVVKKKSKKTVSKKISEAKLNELADKALSDFKEASEERYRQAMIVYEQQDSDTRDALDRMIDLLTGIARRRMWVAPTRQSEHRAVVEIPNEVVQQNMTYMAVEILKDLAQMDVRVASFTFPSDICGVCHDPVKTKKKRKVK